MKTTSAELKKRAKARLKGRYGLCVGTELILSAVAAVFIMIYFICALFIGIANASLFIGGSESVAGSIIMQIIIVFFSIIMMAAMGLLAPGILKLYYHISTNRNPGFSDLLFGLKNKPMKFLGLYMIRVLIGFVCAIPYLVVFVVAVITDFLPVMAVLLVLMYVLLLAGTVISSIYLSQSTYILIEATDKGVLQSVRESVEMMRGNKGRLFYIYLSFIGMMILGYFSMCIGFLWILPYIHATLTEFYLDIKEQQTSKTYTRLPEDSYESMRHQENW
ncbi:DUF975 family protein [Lacrimispora sp. JR3]|uniref:DUF975 family protein n=1 Tax=Lacrimispora sinapis TaxID=3111456 RepID=UPI0037485C61